MLVTRAIRFQFITAILLVAHALIHPALHWLPQTEAVEVVVSAPFPADEQSTAEPKPPCLGCLQQRRLDLVPLLVSLSAPVLRWEYVFVGSQLNLAAAESFSQPTRAPPSS